MTPTTLLARITGLTDIINDPKADNTAGRKETLRYEVLPKLLVDNLNLITAALKEKVEREEQKELFR
jgi:hypothetical protein